jgi:two-component system cell cycle response regulator DivK
MRRRSILLINQDADTVQICTALFSARGFDVRAVEGAEEALRVARAEPPAVIVTELLVRTEAGWEIIQRLKGDAEVARIPLIALTAFALEDDRNRARAADLFVPKPANLEEVLAAVERCTRGAAPPAGRPAEH